MLKVKTKILLTVIPLMVLLTIFMNVSFGIFFERFILLQEENQINTAVDGISTYLQERLIKNQGTANDWGHWNDTYEFIERLNDDYIRNNLDESTFENLNLNFMIFTDLNDNIVYQLYYSMEDQEFTQFPESFELTDDRLSFLQLEEDVSSILKLGDAFYFVSATEITDSVVEEAPNGRLIIGREFKNSIITDLERISGWKFYFAGGLENPEQVTNPTELTSVLSQTYSGEKDYIKLTLLVRNLYQIQESIQLDFEMPRTLYLSSMSNTVSFAILNTLLFAFAAVLIVLALTRLLTKPFDDLLQEVLIIDPTKNKYSKLAETGNKEFFFLRKSINTLLGKIEDNQEKISHMALHDTLTDIPNRVRFNELLDKEIKSSHQARRIFGVVFIDLDEFKSVNDILGHEIGDELIQQVVQRITQTMSKEDIVARFGGDEFLLIIKNVAEVADLDQKVAHLMKLFNTPFILKGMEFFVTCSAGIAVYPTDGETSDQLLKSADMAMYNVKNRGKNAYAFSSPLMKEDLTEQMELTNHLYRALERNELEVYYQPQISVVNNKIVGFEALLRWNHPSKGLLLPGKFISLAEHTRLINPIGQWVLETVCLQIKRWQDMDLNTIKIAINVSPVQFLDPDFLGMIKSTISEANIQPKYLEIEITESIATNKSLNIEPVLRDLKELGVSIAIDDFGSEYSSLSRLKTLSVDRIKMDMQFVHSISKSEKDDAIAKIIIQLAKNLEMNVIAEGIETENQMRFLTSNACDEVQGFYYYRPMQAADAEKLLLEQRNEENVSL